MKKLIFSIALALCSVTAWATPTAGYFRVWQGFQKPELSQQEFITGLPVLMKATVDLYAERALNNYIVVMPPKVRPAYVPDELALVALSSEEDYQQIRSTPEGQQYSELHWDYFDRNTSQSAKNFIDYSKELPSRLINNAAYDMIGTSIDWANGANFVYIGTRKNALTNEEFLARLKTHVELAKTVMNPKGLRGYIIIANENFEVAYLNWESKEAHDKAVQSSEGSAVFADASEFMDTLMYEPALSFKAGEPISEGAVYSTLQRNQTVDPISYATEASQYYAQGDSNDSSGWETCEYLTPNKTLRIECSGTRDILVHGGEMFTVDFSCSFNFAMLSSSNGEVRYEILAEDCR